MMHRQTNNPIPNEPLPPSHMAGPASAGTGLHRVARHAGR